MPVRLGAARWLALLLLWPVTSVLVRGVVPPPDAVALASPWRPLSETGTRYLVDDSWIDAAGERQLSQQIFDQLLVQIAEARSLIVVDLFLWNDWQGPIAEDHRALSIELTDALLARLAEPNPVAIIVITDPINKVYGGLPSASFNQLEQAGAKVVWSDLQALQDSNPLWSDVWRWLIRPFGNAPGDTVPNPFGEGRVTLRSYLSLLNFKANHRKLLISDSGPADAPLQAMVTSANPHDGSSAHRNTALQFQGAAALDLLQAERMLLELCDRTDAVAVLDEALGALAGSDAVAGSPLPTMATAAEPAIAIVGESAIKTAVLSALSTAGDGDAVDLSMFYLADRDIITALKAAHARGAQVRVLLDVNQDAFGREKGGVPNRPVAAELFKAGIAVRWCHTAGEQCHSKWLQVRTRAGHRFFLGSANFTRRNLDDYNLETDVQLRLPAGHPLAATMSAHFETLWQNAPGQSFSLPYAELADNSVWLRLQYRFMEATGMSTF